MIVLSGGQGQHADSRSISSDGGVSAATRGHVVLCVSYAAITILFGLESLQQHLGF